MITKRLMIIVWKWMDLQADDRTWDEARIEEHDCDKIIRIEEHKSQDAKNRIYEFIREHSQADVFIFLHRDHDYSSPDVKEMMHHVRTTGLNGNLIKVFLFSEGRDYIYYSVDQEGLLDEIGNFKSGFDTIETINEFGEIMITSKKVKVASFNREIGKWVVYPKHFNKVWKHYKHEFKKKISRLQIELISFLVEIPSDRSNNTPYSFEEWDQKVRQDQLLYARMKSFLNLYETSVVSQLPASKKKAWKKEYEYLKDVEIDDEISLVFDDCNANLVEMDGARKAYNDLNQKLCPLFLDNHNKHAQVSLTEINKLFSNLVACLPK